MAGSEKEAPTEGGPPRRRRLYSGIQPTGDLHIGNYLGAIANWVRLSQPFAATFGIVDYHAMTMPYEPKVLSDRIREMAADLIACGLDPEICTLYVQSQGPAHTELAWILSCVAPMGELERMTQFKDKARQSKKTVNAGLFTYPILQTADILLYKGEAVPVGEDQLQHLELSRVIARAFNRRFGKTFPEPKPIVGDGARILGLDGQSKMSKSLDNQVELAEAPESYRKKLARAVTDTQRVRRDDPGRPEVCNIFTLHGHFTPEQEREEMAAGCRTAAFGCYDCKMRFCDHMETVLGPIRERSLELRARPAEIDGLLAEGASRASAVAAETLREVRERTGIAGPFGRTG